MAIVAELAIFIPVACPAGIEVDADGGGMVEVEAGGPDVCANAVVADNAMVIKLNSWYLDICSCLVGGLRTLEQWRGRRVRRSAAYNQAPSNSFGSVDKVPHRKVRPEDLAFVRANPNVGSGDCQRRRNIAAPEQFTPRKLDAAIRNSPIGLLEKPLICGSSSCGPSCQIQPSRFAPCYTRERRPVIICSWTIAAVRWRVFGYLEFAR